jgi:hypothetical protein
MKKWAQPTENSTYHLCPYAQISLCERGASGRCASSLGIWQNPRTGLFLFSAHELLIPDIRLPGPDARTGDVDVGHIAVAHHALDTHLLDGCHDRLHRRLCWGRVTRVGGVVEQVLGAEHEGRAWQLWNGAQRRGVPWGRCPSGGHGLNLCLHVRKRAKVQCRLWKPRQRQRS